MSQETLSDLMVGIEEMVGEKLDWKEENNQVVLQKRELALICETLSRQFYELRNLKKV